jgi:glutathione peroxidase-family protein
MKNKIYEINIDKSDSKIINDYLFEPKIVKFVNSTSICCYLNFPYNWTCWILPKKLHNKDIEIISFNKNKIVIGFD